MKIVHSMLAAAATAVLVLVPVAKASPGDWLDEFLDCRDACEYRRSCANSDIHQVSEQNPFWSFPFQETPGVYRLLLWDCVADCDHQCQQAVTQMRIAADQEVYQFHGKWPFKRMLGMQELFSTLFSIGNFVPQYRGFRLLLRERNVVPPHLKSRLILDKYTYVAVAGMLAWLSSTVFHLRDLLVTEKLDYFFAGATVLAGFHAILVRIARLDTSDLLRHAFSTIVALTFSAHILRLYLDWSYTYNMRFNVFFGVLQYVLLLLLSLQNYRAIKGQDHRPKPRSRSRYAATSGLVWDLCAMPALLVVGTSLAMTCELFDFFSYRWQIDSHAIWHVCTIVPSWILYDFFLRDFRHLVASETALE